MTFRGSWLLIALLASVVGTCSCDSASASEPHGIPAPSATRVGSAGSVTTLTGETIWPAGSRIALDGSVIVEAGASLTIGEGTRIEAAVGTSIVVSRDARLSIAGTLAQPVVLTCQPGATKAGCWNGLVILGNAPINHGAQTSASGSRGGAGGCRESTLDGALYGGCTADDSSGVVRFARIQYATFGLRLFGVGSRTALQDIQVHRSLGHGIEIVGGMAQLRHLALTTNAQYGLAYSGGWTGQAQYVVIQQDATGYAGGILGRNAIGASGDQNAFPRSAPVLANLTIVTPPSAPSNPFASAAPAALRFDRGAAGRLYNALLVHAGIGVDVDDAATCAQVLNGTLAISGIALTAPVTSTDPDADPNGCAGQGELSLVRNATTVNGAAATTQLTSAIDLLLPDLRPVAGSVIAQTVGTAPPAGGIIEPVSYLGALAPPSPSVGIPWYSGWTIGEQLAPAALVTLNGRVLGTGGAGVAGAALQVLPTGATATTDAAGRFAVASIPAGPVEISVVSGVPADCEAPPIARAVASSTAVPLDVVLSCGPTTVNLNLFGVATVPGSRGVALASAGRYAVLPQFAATQDFASGSQREMVPTFPYLIGGSAGSLTAGMASQRPVMSLSVLDAFHARLRAIERAEAPRAISYMQQVRARGPVSLRVEALAAAEERNFQVLSSLSASTYLTVTARLAYTGSNVLVYVDNQPVSGPTFTDTEYAALGRQFDVDMYPIDLASFGAPSDIDGDGKVIILFTPVVNRLTLGTGVCGAYVAGYFNGIDVSGSPTGNRAEVFYGAVPGEPAGGPACTSLSTASVRNTAPATFIHELQHLISYNQHVLVRARGTEEVWLNEGLSHLAEELGGKLYESRYPCPNGPPCPPAGRTSSSQLFPDSAQGFLPSNFGNAYRFFTTRSTYSLTSPLGFATTEERGAAWLFLRWLADQKGESRLPQLVQTLNTGTANIEAVAGESFQVLFADFLAATLLDDFPGASAGQIASRYQYASRDLRMIYARLNVTSPTSFPTAYLLDLNDLAAARRLTVTSGVSAQQMKPGTFDLFQFTAGVSGEGVVFFGPVSGVFPAGANGQVTVVRVP